MLEFVFFDPRPRRRFVEFLQTHAVAVTELEDDETLGVGIPEDVDDDVMEAIEACYDEMMTFNQQLFEAEAGTADNQAAGVVLTLGSGDTVYARVDPILLGRIMEVLTPQELGEVVNAIVDAVENPDDSPLCHTPGTAGRG